MADFIIKPTSGNLILKDDQNVARVTIAPTSGATTLSNQVFPAGHIVQTQSFSTSTYVNGSVVLSGLDDTIPQKTEGDEYMTLAITPASATNKLLIEVVFYLKWKYRVLSYLMLFVILVR